ncbi:TPA: DnaD domain-containing protein [Listeria innocua]|uniref:DnaD protein n=1 Tax=Listeria innocua serovar 6a (strain ATCC BAA-680 / CLIP 11262) TaxID=272626 RepID=Q92AB3_LISIN|nr:DnaD domain-containing protein [Listeria innocua]ECC1682311.1 DnaD domain-containing protein [Listeria innocua]EEQ0536205.1 DnaD domain-containing protein [Listeria innocua]EHD9220326.1 DnaD domain-containing protein [Listeria innocua]EHF3595402.1 DnaD domain-containing protein [Listeria innocua]EHF3598365.1 DnaD domain-containing protein [Listeria innocua]
MDHKMLEKWMAEGQVTLPQVLVKNYAAIGLNENELVLLLQIQSFAAEAEFFPSMEMLTDRTTLRLEDTIKTMDSLLKKSVVAIEQSKDNSLMISEQYNLEPLWGKLVAFYENIEADNRQDLEVEQQTNLYSLFEAEFGRPLSPMEAEMLSAWVDQDRTSPDLIKEALKEAVISQKLNFRYIDRILLNWSKQGVKTIDDAKRVAEEFHQNGRTSQTINQSEVKKSAGSIPLYDWLEKRKG